MEKLLSDFIEALIPQSDAVIYAFLFVSAIVENLFPPIPGDTITALGAFLVGTGRLNFFLVYVLTTMGSVFGFMVLYYIGRRLERQFFMAKDYRFFSAESIIAAERWFGKYGYFVVLANRFLPGIRSVISIVSGISELNQFRVFLYSFFSVSLWNFIWIYAGYTLGNNWSVVKDRLAVLVRHYNIGAAVFFTLAVSVFITVKVIKKMRMKNSCTRK